MAITASLKYEEVDAQARKFKSDADKIRDLYEKYDNLVKKMEWAGDAADEAKVALGQLHRELIDLKGYVDHLSAKASEEVARMAQADKEAVGLFQER